MQALKNYLSLIKFSHTVFALPFAIIGFVLGVKRMQQDITQSPTSYGVKLLLVLGCMVTARSAAMAFNRYLDRNFDALNPRTAIREIPSGIIRPAAALRFVLVNAALFILFAGLINMLCLALSPVALFVILFYSYTKRFTPLCHFVLGLGLSLAPIGAYLAVTGQFHMLPMMFSLIVLLWVSGFDIIFSLQDEAFDKSQGLKSIPTLLGVRGAIGLSRGLHIATALLVLAAGLIGGLGTLYWLGAVCFTGMLVYQHTLFTPQNLSGINLAFMSANGAASIIFSLFVITDVLV